MLSQYGSLARDRMQQAERTAAQRRLVARLSSERRWHRLAVLAHAHQLRASQRADEARTAYSLAG
jgi:hypothetical protein